MFCLTCGPWLIIPQFHRAFEALNPCQGYVWLTGQLAGRSEVSSTLLRARMRSISDQKHVTLCNGNISSFCIHVTLTWANRLCLDCKPIRTWTWVGLWTGLPTSAEQIRITLHYLIPHMALKILVNHSWQVDHVVNWN